MDGAIYLTRNTDEVGNDSPGFWNHSAIVYKDTIIEAQAIPKCVIQVTEDSFRDRYPEWILLNPLNEVAGEVAAWEATKLIGEPYKRFASFFFKRDRGYNCVSLCRKVYMIALGFDPMWVQPDHIISFLFTQIERKVNYNWMEPEDWFNGRIA